MHVFASLRMNQKSKSFRLCGVMDYQTITSRCRLAVTNKGAVDGPPPVIVIDCGNHFRLDTLSSAECVCVCVCVGGGGARFVLPSLTAQRSRHLRGMLMGVSFPVWTGGAGGRRHKQRDVGTGALLGRRLRGGGGG